MVFAKTALLSLLTLLSTSVVAAPSAANAAVAAKKEFTGPQVAVLAANDENDPHNPKIEVKYKGDLLYTTPGNDEEDNGLSLYIHYESKVGVAELETIEKYIDDVDCSSDKIELRIANREHREQVRLAYQDAKLAITSHWACNRNDGARQVFRVKSVTAARLGMPKLIMDVEQVEWQGTFDRLDMSFGEAQPSHKVRRANLAARGMPGWWPFKRFPGVPKEMAVDLKYSMSGQHIMSVDKKVEVKCDDCSATGSLQISRGKFSIDLNPMHFDLRPHGTVKFSSTGVEANTDISLRPTKLANTTIPLHKTSIIGFLVPGIGFASLTYKNSLILNCNAHSQAEMALGFTASIPADTELVVNFPNFKDTDATPFKKLKLTNRKFEMVSDVPEMKFSAALIPEVMLDFNFFNAVQARVVVGLTLPELEVQVTPRHSVDEKCMPKSFPLTDLGDDNEIDDGAADQDTSATGETADNGPQIHPIKPGVENEDSTGPQIHPVKPGVEDETTSGPQIHPVKPGVEDETSSDSTGPQIHPIKPGVEDDATSDSTGPQIHPVKPNVEDFTPQVEDENASGPQIHPLKPSTLRARRAIRRQDTPPFPASNETAEAQAQTPGSDPTLATWAEATKIHVRSRLILGATLSGGLRIGSPDGEVPVARGRGIALWGDEIQLPSLCLDRTSFVDGIRGPEWNGKGNRAGSAQVAHEEEKQEEQPGRVL